MTPIQLVAAAACLAMCALGHAQQAADAGRTLRIVVPFAAGTPVDAAARVLAPKLAESLGRTVVVEDKPGAAGMLGTREVAKSSSQRDVLLFTVHNSVVVNPYLYSNLGYERTELEPVAFIGGGSYLLVASRESGVKSLADLVAAAKARPGALRFGSYGVGSGPHLCMEVFMQTTGLSLSHIPYKGSPLNDLAGGNVDLSMEPPAAAIPFVDEGRLNAIGYTTRLKTGRSKSALSSITETMGSYECGNWVGLFAAAGAGTDFASRMHEEVSKILQQPEVRQRIQLLGIEPMPMTRVEFRSYVDNEYTRWGKIVRDAGVKME